MVSNADVVRTLERIADLLEIRGENTFKVQAYGLAALQVENLARCVADLAADQHGLGSVDSVGAAIADKMGELVATGRCSYLERLEAEIPPTSSTSWRCRGWVPARSPRCGVDTQ